MPRWSNILATHTHTHFQLLNAHTIVKSKHSLTRSHAHTVRFDGWLGDKSSSGIYVCVVYAIYPLPSDTIHRYIYSSIYMNVCMYDAYTTQCYMECVVERRACDINHRRHGGGDCCDDALPPPPSRRCCWWWWRFLIHVRAQNIFLSVPILICIVYMYITTQLLCCSIHIYETCDKSSLRKLAF